MSKQLTKVINSLQASLENENLIDYFCLNMCNVSSVFIHDSVVSLYFN